MEYETSYKDDFFEKHPNALKDVNGDPKPCRKVIYGEKKCPNQKSCHECWNEIKEDE